MVTVTVDTREFDAFTRQYPVAARGAAKKWLLQGAQIVRTRMVKHGKANFKEPTGAYNASISNVFLIDEAQVGPKRPYNWWIEAGRNAPRGVPASHRGSSFTGYHIVEKATRDSMVPLQLLLEGLMRDAKARSMP